MKKMTRILSLFLALTLVLALAACGGSGNGNNGGNGAQDPGGDQTSQEAPDLKQYYEDFMATLGEDNTPAMMEAEGDMVEGVYPGLTALDTKQLVVRTAMISSVAFEFALVELADAADVQAAADILQARVDYQIESGAFYPATVESWENAQIITKGNVVALICASDEQTQAVEAFEALFE